MFLRKHVWHKTRMLYGDDMLLSTIVLKLSGAVVTLLNTFAFIL